MTDPNHFHYDLRARAYQAMLDEGFAPELPPAAADQLHEIAAHPPHTGASGEIQDMRGLLWSSIDNDESRDLDQIEAAERLPNGEIRVLVGIADVDAAVPENTPIDRQAAANTTSVYTGVVTFPMLPEALSEDLTSLRQDADRLALVMEMIVGPDGAVRDARVSRALVRNRARLAYDGVGAWLENTGPMPEAIAHVVGMADQLRLQNEAAHSLRTQRQQRGSLDFDMVEAQPVVAGGRVVDLKLLHKSAARSLIEDFMVAANAAMADLLVRSGAPSIQRVVRAPERWARIVEIAERLGERLPAIADPRALSDFLARRKAVDPVHFPDLPLSIVKLLGPGEYAVIHSPQEHAGHFGLAVYSYTHSTAPNRRFADLVTQRLLKALISGAAPPYASEELETIALRCTERENAARKVERLMRKVAAAALLAQRIGAAFDAIVTGAAPKGTYVRLLAPPVEGRVVQGEHGMDVGDHVRVRLIATDPQRGFIDFARA